MKTQNATARPSTKSAGTETASDAGAAGMAVPATRPASNDAALIAKVAAIAGGAFLLLWILDKGVIGQ
jgi:hypothetical protein